MARGAEEPQHEAGFLTLLLAVRDHRVGHARTQHQTRGAHFPRRVALWRFDSGGVVGGGAGRGPPGAAVAERGQGRVEKHRMLVRDLPHPLGHLDGARVVLGGRGGLGGDHREPDGRVRAEALLAAAVRLHEGDVHARGLVGLDAHGVLRVAEPGRARAPRAGLDHRLHLRPAHRQRLGVAQPFEGLGCPAALPAPRPAQVDLDVGHDFGVLRV
mmetsp:Transcript_296/g.651  ORF Transcript_296/g.651 Transcript_296/m.651 type:complete len:214 (-) Transcript_296:1122-1763(-)